MSHASKRGGGIGVGFGEERRGRAYLHDVAIGFLLQTPVIVHIIADEPQHSNVEVDLPARHQPTVVIHSMSKSASLACCKPGKDIPVPVSLEDLIQEQNSDIEDP